jgi:D-glycero-alpha-D-manno-heptose 1-phosphate guanylyltransferase
MEAIILAGGLGTRLQSIIGDLPKPMAPVGGKPFLWYLLSSLGKCFIKRVILAVGYKYRVIQEYFGTRFAALDIDYSVEEEPLGTGGGIRRALNKVTGPQTLILNGDTFFDIDYSKLFDIHLDQKVDLTIALKPMWDFDRYGNVLTINSRVVGFEEKKEMKFGNINGGVYLINTNVFADLDLGAKFSFEKDFLEKYVERLNFYAYISDSYFIDIGVPEDYYKAQIELVSVFNN